MVLEGPNFFFLVLQYHITFGWVVIWCDTGFDVMMLLNLMLLNVCICYGMLGWILKMYAFSNLVEFFNSAKFENLLKFENGWNLVGQKCAKFWKWAEFRKWSGLNCNN
jgi:hypothetical protein